MSETGKTGKRIVSQGEYLFHLGLKAVFGFCGSLLLLLGFAVALLTCVGSVWMLVTMLRHHASLGEYFYLLFGVFLLAFVSHTLLSRGRKAIEEARYTEAGLPLTRANTADLPAPESLVRASAEPTQAQEAILLRPATHTSETPAEQLVRPAEPTR